MRRVVDEDDRRSFFAALTPDGHRRLRESRPTHNEVVRSHLTRRLTTPQLAKLGDLWDVILRADLFEHALRSSGQCRPEIGVRGLEVGEDRFRRAATTRRPDR